MVNLGILPLTIGVVTLIIVIINRKTINGAIFSENPKFKPAYKYFFPIAIALVIGSIIFSGFGTKWSSSELKITGGQYVYNEDGSIKHTRDGDYEIDYDFDRVVTQTNGSDMLVGLSICMLVVGVGLYGFVGFFSNAGRTMFKGTRLPLQGSIVGKAADSVVLCYYDNLSGRSKSVDDYKAFCNTFWGYDEVFYPVLRQDKFEQFFIKEWNPELITNWKKEEQERFFACINAYKQATSEAAASEQAASNHAIALNNAARITINCFYNHMRGHYNPDGEYMLFFNSFFSADDVLYQDKFEQFFIKEWNSHLIANWPKHDQDTFHTRLNVYKQRASE